MFTQIVFKMKQELLISNSKQQKINDKDQLNNKKYSQYIQDICLDGFSQFRSEYQFKQLQANSNLQIEDEDISQLNISSDYQQQQLFQNLTICKTQKIDYNSKTQSNKLQNQKSYEPNLYDIQYTISKIKRYIQDQRVNKVIQYFFKKWLQSICQNRQQQHQGKEANSVNSKLLFEDRSRTKGCQSQTKICLEKTVKNNDNVSKLKADLMKNSRTFSNIDNPYGNDFKQLSDLSMTRRQCSFRMRQKKIAAQLFVQKGYGDNVLQFQLSKAEYAQILPRNIYSQVTTLVVLDSYKRLQKSLTQDFCRQILTLNWSQLQLLIHFFIYARSHWAKSKFNTLLKYIKIDFNLEEVIVLESEALLLYAYTLQQLYRLTNNQKYNIQQNWNIEECRKQRMMYKINSSNHHSFREQQQEWNQQIQCEFVTAYLQCGSIKQISKSFGIKYGVQTKRASFYFLRNKFEQIIRSALRKMSSLAKKHPKHYLLLNPIPQESKKDIISNLYGHQIRQKLFRVTDNKFADPRLINSTVASVNAYVKLRQKQQIILQNQKQI